MAIQSERTSSGLVILRDSKTKELAGSIGEGKESGVPKVNPVKAPQAETPASPLSLIDIASQRFANHLKNVAAFTTAEQKAAGPQAYEELSYNLARSMASDLDDVQFADIYRLLMNSVKKIKSEDLLPPTNEQWAQWITDTEARILSVQSDFDTETIAHLLSQLDKVKSNRKPDGLGYAVLMRLEKKVWAAKYSLDEGYRQISAWFDVSPVEVKWQVAKFRKEYLEAEAAGNAPAIPEVYAKGYKFTSGSGPKDLATIYGHYMAENPELYDESAVPTRFVAFDTETTGLDSRSANVIQIGLVEFDHDGNETRRYVTYIRPPLDANGVLSTGDEGAVNAHKILPEDVADAPSFADAMPKIKEFLEGSTVIAQNGINFDAKHLSAEYIRASGGDKSAGNNLWNRAADTLWYAQRHLDKDALGLADHKLATLNTHFGLPPFNAHDAGEDAHATGRLFFHIRSEMKQRQRAASKRRRENDFWTIEA